jgi:hypothetical protein
MEEQIETEVKLLLALLKIFTNDQNDINRQKFMKNLISLTFKIDNCFYHKLLNEEIYNKFCNQIENAEKEFQEIEYENYKINN